MDGGGKSEMEPLSREPKDVTVEMDDRFFQVTISMKDESLIEEMLDALSRDVDNGSSLRIRHVQWGALSSSQYMVMKIISHPRQLAPWRAELKTIMSAAIARKP
jgi:hypothetical protein